MKSILLVDEDASAMRACLQPRRDYKIQEAGSAKDVLQWFIESKGRIDLLIVSVSPQPGISGIDLAVNLRGFVPKMKILLTTADASLACTNLQVAALNRVPSGHLKYLRKPFTPLDFLRKVDDLLLPAVIGSASRGRTLRAQVS